MEYQKHYHVQATVRIPTVQLPTGRLYSFTWIRDTYENALRQKARLYNGGLENLVKVEIIPCEDICLTDL